MRLHVTLACLLAACRAAVVNQLDSDLERDMTWDDFEEENPGDYLNRLSVHLFCQSICLSGTNPFSELLSGMLVYAELKSGTRPKCDFLLTEVHIYQIQ